METVAAVFGFSLMLLDEEEQREERRPRSAWVHDWVQKRETEGCYAKLLQELRFNHPKLYKKFVRMSAEDFDFLLALTAPLIQKQDTKMRKSISPGERLAVTLRFLATGESFMSLQYLFRIPQPTISSIVPEVCRAIYTVLKDLHMKVPTTQAEWEGIAKRFNESWNFPNCLGAVDGKHVVMVAPSDAGSVFYNYKGTHSIVLMGIADADYRFIYADVGTNGRMSDGGVFKKCTFVKAIEQGQLNIPPPRPLPGRDIPVPFVLVGDDAFAMKSYLLKPYSGRTLTGLSRIFNYRLSRSRRIIENVFGIMSARFRVLRKPINLDETKTEEVTLACCALHNFLIDRNRDLYAPVGSFDRYDGDGEFIPGEWRQDFPDVTLYSLDKDTPYIANDAKLVREEYAEYFVNEGEVPWQYKLVVP